MFWSARLLQDACPKSAFEEVMPLTCSTAQRALLANKLMSHMSWAVLAQGLFQWSIAACFWSFLVLSYWSFLVSHDISQCCILLVLRWLWCWGADLKPTWVARQSKGSMRGLPGSKEALRKQNDQNVQALQSWQRHKVSNKCLEIDSVSRNCVRIEFGKWRLESIEKCIELWMGLSQGSNVTYSRCTSYSRSYIFLRIELSNT